MLLARFFAAGQTNHVVDLSCHLARLGHEVTLLYSQPSAAGQIHRAHHLQSLRDAGVRVVEPAPDSSWWQGLLPVDVIHAHSTLDFTRARYLGIQLRVPYVLTVHGTGVAGGRYSAALRSAGAVIAVGWRVAKQLFGQARRIYVIENGVDTERFRPAEEGGAAPSSPAAEDPARPFTVCYSGRVDPSKRNCFRQFAQGVVLAAERNPVRLMVMAVSLPTLGSELRPKLERLLDFRGWVWDPAPVYREADVVAGSGRVVREGLASGLPCLVVGPSYGGIVFPSSLDPSRGHDFSGRPAELLLCDPDCVRGDVERLAGDPDLALRLGREGRQYAVEHLSLDRMATEVVDVYRQVTGGHPGT